MKKNSSPKMCNGVTPDEPKLTRIYIDGAGARPDGMGSCFAWLREDTRQKNIERRDGLSNNQAEYHAFLSALESLPENSAAEILTDSQIVACQFNRTYKVYDFALEALLAQARELIQRKKLSITVAWIRRQQNLAGKLI